MSLQAWTPFYWEQDRYGMLVPLLATPLRQPLVNLLAQEGLTIFAGLSCFFLLARYVVADRRWPLVGAAGAASFVLLASPRYQFTLLSTAQPLGVSLAFGLVALLIVRPLATPHALARLALATALVTVAAWVNVVIGVVLLALVVLRRLLLDTPGLEATIAVVIASALGRLFMVLAPHRPTPLQLLSPGETLAGIGRLGRSFWSTLAAPAWPAVLVLAAAAGAVALLVRQDGRDEVVRPAAVLGTSAAVYLLFVASQTWTAMNGFGPSYSLPVVVLLQAAPVIVAVTPVARRLERTGRWTLGYGAAAASLFLAVAVAYGAPSLDGVRAQLARTIGSRTVDVVEARVTHVHGDYWEVWPTVFHANLVLRERGSSHEVWGVAYRSEPTWRRWREMPADTMRVAVPRGEREAARWTSPLPPLVEVERRPSITVWRPVSATR